MNLAKKSCALDPTPTPLLIKCIDVLSPVLTKMVNISLESGHFPSAWKEALVRLILKKNGLHTVFKNYRPVFKAIFSFLLNNEKTDFLVIGTRQQLLFIYYKLIFLRSPWETLQ